MTVIPKHEVTTPAPRKGNKKPPQPAVAAVAAAPAITLDVDMTGVEAALAKLACSVSSYGENTYLGENKLAVFTELDGYPVKVHLESETPIKITLADNVEEDTIDRLVTAFERIADSVAMLAGLNRPRLESWHEQCEYEPRYKDVACDGGAPGPETKTS